MHQSSLPQRTPLAVPPKKPCVLFIEEQLLIVEAFRTIFTPIGDDPQASVPRVLVHLSLPKAIEYMSMGIYEVVILGTDMEDAETVAGIVRDLHGAKREGPKPPVIVFSKRVFDTVPEGAHATVTKANFTALLAAMNTALDACTT